MTLTLIEDTNQRSVKGRIPVFKCQCHCGSYINIKKTTFESKSLTHCGCEIREGYRYSEPSLQDYPSPRYKTYEIKGISKKLSEWYEEYKPKASIATIEKRLKEGWDPEIALITIPNVRKCNLPLGSKHSQLTVTQLNKDGTCLCLCNCGNSVEIAQHLVASKSVSNCGCRNHQMSKSPTYESWASMKARCLNKNDTNYNNYGGRGITLDPRWHTFQNFLEDMGERTKTQSLERLDVNGNYESSNCIWLEKNLQSKNTRSTVSITIEGETQNLTYWLNKFNVSHASYNKRIQRGLSPVEALNSASLEKNHRIRVVELDGKVFNLAEACRYVGSAVSYNTVVKRMNEGMPFEDAVLKAKDWDSKSSREAQEAKAKCIKYNSDFR